MSLPSSALAPVSGADWPMGIRLALTPAGWACAPAIAAANTAAAAIREKVRLSSSSTGMPFLRGVTVGIPFAGAIDRAPYEQSAQDPCTVAAPHASAGR